MYRCDVIVPVFNAYDYLAPCINSLLKYTKKNSTKIILVDDCSTDKRVLPLLEEYEKKEPGRIVLIKNDENLGFVKTVNKGIRSTKNDIVLLNSDTIVTKEWLDKIVHCAQKSEKIATVTPLSNNLTPVQIFPESFRVQGHPAEYSIEETASIVDQFSMHVYPDIPSSHGFCMLIKRNAIKEVGYFDEDTFGKGYGEENDFCFRCLYAGYRHVLCDDTYIFHAGSKSFLDKKEFHSKELEEKHPEVMNKVGLWYQDHCLDYIANNVMLAIASRINNRNILIINSDAKIEMNTFMEENKNLREKYNFHFLCPYKEKYVLYSYFKYSDFATAVYKKECVVGDEKNTNRYEKMIEEIKQMYGIGLIINSRRDLKTINKSKKKSIVFLAAQAKLAETDLVMSIEKKRECALDNGSQPKKSLFARGVGKVKHSIIMLLRKNNEQS